MNKLVLAFYEVTFASPSLTLKSFVSCMKSCLESAVLQSGFTESHVRAEVQTSQCPDVGRAGRPSHGHLHASRHQGAYPQECPTSRHQSAQMVFP